MLVGLVEGSDEMSVIIPEEQVGLVKQHNGPELVQLVGALDASSTDECVDCGMELGGLLGMFQWGIVHGQGECSRCGFPYVYYHYHEVRPAVPAPMRYPRRAEEIRLQAWVPNAEIPLSPSPEGATTP